MDILTSKQKMALRELHWFIKHEMQPSILCLEQLGALNYKGELNNLWKTIFKINNIDVEDYSNDSN